MLLHCFTTRPKALATIWKSRLRPKVITRLLKMDTRAVEAAVRHELQTSTDFLASGPVSGKKISASKS
eukprot:717024-Lingulodinium_polyedra.AAC.1